ncbi:MAG: hypothetical protein LBF93_04355 [Zoogloeaceae bacterium]|jgi:hypothetical protein|nr:hypothetical protein [Zoogloeaceae bacterium]
MNEYPNFIEYIQSTLTQDGGWKPLAGFSVDLPATATFSPEGGLALVFLHEIPGIPQAVPISLHISAEATESLRSLLSHAHNPGEKPELVSRRTSQ